MDYNHAAEFTRQNTGSHFLDSGGTYGRIHQTPTPEQRSIISDKYGDSINVTALLADCFDVEEQLQRMVDLAAGASARYRDLSWFEVSDKFMAEMGYECAARDNTYNGENDLDQDFIWEVWERSDDQSSDWIWNEEAVIVLFLHTGADIRGGYSSPLIGKFAGDYAIPVDTCVEYALEAVDVGSDPFLWQQHEEIAEDFNEGGEGCAGYSSHPRYHMESMGMVFGEEFDSEGRRTLVWDGRTFYVHPCRPYMGE